MTSTTRLPMPGEITQIPLDAGEGAVAVADSGLIRVLHVGDPEYDAVIQAQEAGTMAKAKRGKKGKFVSSGKPVKRSGPPPRIAKKLGRKG